VGASFPSPTPEYGFTIVEVMVAAFVLLVGVLAMLNVLDMANAVTTTHRSRDVATNLARQITESARAVPYAALIPETIEQELQDQPGLASTTSDGWGIERHRIQFSVSVGVVSVDDPSDGTGSADKNPVDS
jgi:Tfp pilus assembly protein PilE